MKTYKTLFEENKAWALEIFKKIDAKESKVAVRSREKLPYTVDENGTHISRPGAATSWWTNGFFGGMNALLYSYTKNEDYLKTLESSEKLLDGAFADNYNILHHDVGFLWHLTSGANFTLTGNEASKKRVFYAAATLCGRFINGGDFIKAWNTPRAYNWTIIDSMMNLALLYNASDLFGDDRYKRMAMAHADSTIASHIRPDGSVAHQAEHDRDTGEVVATYGGQGSGVGSSWSRGQAWALYGFVISYLHTKEERYLDAAKRVANYFIANCCDDWLPRVDFRSAAEPIYYDSTAGACAACGLLELAKILPECEGGMYMFAAVNLMKAMTEKFANFDTECDNLLDYGTERYPTEGDPKLAGVHMNIIYGDFFYVEAILKMLDSDFMIW